MADDKIGDNKRGSEPMIVDVGASGSEGIHASSPAGGELPFTALPRSRKGDKTSPTLVKKGEPIRPKRSKRKRKAGEDLAPEGGQNLKEEMMTLRKGLCEIVNNDANEIDLSVNESIMKVADGYEDIIIKLLCENERLRGKITGMDDMKRELINGMNTRVVSIENEVSKKVVEGVKKVVKKCMNEQMAKAKESFLSIGADVQKDVEMDKRTYACILKGQGGEDAKTVKEKFKEVIGKETNVKIKAVKETKDGGVAVEMLSANDQNELMRNENLRTQGVNVCVAKRVTPRIIVYDVPKEWDDNYVLEELYKRNVDGIMDYEEYVGRVKVVMRNGKRDANVVNLVIECPFELRGRLLRMGRVFVCTYSFRVNVFEKVFRCYNCYGYGHRARECTEKEICRKCGGEGHKGESCRKSESCRNCCNKGRRGQQAAHSVLSPECPEYKWRLELLRERMDYG